MNAWAVMKIAKIIYSIRIKIHAIINAKMVIFKIKVNAISVIKNAYNVLVILTMNVWVVI